MRKIFYFGGCGFRYYLPYVFDKAFEVSEEDFFKIVGYDRKLVPMKYDPDNINRQNFYLDGILLAYRVRV